MVMTEQMPLESDWRGDAVDMEPVSNPPSLHPLRMKNAEVTSGFGMRFAPNGQGKQMHNGIDFRAPRGTFFQAPAHGEVIEVGEDEKRGKYVVLRHDDVYTTRYFHLDEVIVPLGQKFRIGKDIGKVGDSGMATGTHLHYEVLKNGQPVDPDGYFGDGLGVIEGVLDRLDDQNPSKMQNGVRVSGEGCYRFWA